MHSLKNKKIYPLRNIYELRKFAAVNKRVGAARVFFHKKQMGIVDMSGILWPVNIKAEATPSSGDAIIFASTWENSALGGASKYQDSGFTLTITNIFEAVESSGYWPIEGILSPLPNLDPYTTLETTQTNFVTSQQNKRLSLIEERNFSLERTKRFFNSRQYLWMETPTLVPSGGVERYVSSFTTSYEDARGKKWQLNLPTSPEFALKKLLIEGYPKIYQISHAYRNSFELSKWHEPEFLMLEWYSVGSNLQDIMLETQSLVQALAKDSPSRFSLPHVWPQFSVNELFIKCCNFSLASVQNLEDFIAAGKKISPSVNNNDDWDSVFCKLFMEKIEPFLTTQQACFVTNYPRQMGALAKVSKDPLYVERFEAYLNGVEICNGYNELVDTKELTERFNSIETARPEATSRDPIFEQAASFALPPCSGNALGIDRVIAILGGRDNIKAHFCTPFLSQFPKNTVAAE